MNLCGRTRKLYWENPNARTRECSRWWIPQLAFARAWVSWLFNQLASRSLSNQLFKSFATKRCLETISFNVFSSFRFPKIMSFFGWFDRQQKLVSTFKSSPLFSTVLILFSAVPCCSVFIFSLQFFVLLISLLFLYPGSVLLNFETSWLRFSMCSGILPIRFVQGHNTHAWAAVAI